MSSEHETTLNALAAKLETGDAMAGAAIRSILSDLREERENCNEAREDARYEANRASNAEDRLAELEDQWDTDICDAYASMCGAPVMPLRRLVSIELTAEQLQQLARRWTSSGVTDSFEQVDLTFLEMDPDESAEAPKQDPSLA